MRNCFYTQQLAPLCDVIYGIRTECNISRGSFVLEISSLLQIAMLMLVLISRKRRNRGEEPIQELECAVSLIDMFLRTRDSHGAPETLRRSV